MKVYVHTCENRDNSKGNLAIVDIEHVLDPVVGSALTGIFTTQQTQSFDISGRSLNITAGIIHGCKETGIKKYITNL